MHNKYKNSKKIAVVFAINELYSFCIYVSICSLLKNSPHLMQQSDIIIYNCNMSDRDKNVFNTFDNIRIIDYKFPLKIEKTNAIKIFSIASFARYECFDMLNYYEKVIYLDADILVQKELLNIFNLICENGIGLIKEKTNVKLFSLKIENFSLKKTIFNSGFIVLNRKLKVNFKEITDFCYKTTVQYIKYLYLPSL